MIERCGDRQRKYDGLEKWPLHLFVESLPVMLQASLFLLACGLCQRMWSMNTSVAWALISLTVLGAAFYVAIVIAGMSSYACPFQTPVSITLRSPWKKVRHGITSCVVNSRRALSSTHWTWNRRVRPLLRRRSLLTIPLGSVQVQNSEPWLKPKDFDITRRTNSNDIRCVSWILRNITDPEALDAAIRLAGEIRWFEDGTNVVPPYGLIVTTFEACFDSTGKLYPGSRDRAYYSARAMLWIRTLAMCKSKDFASAFPPPSTEYRAPGLDPDIRQLLWATVALSVDSHIIHWLRIYYQHAPSHSQWVSDVLLHLSWTNQATLNLEYILNFISDEDETATFLSTTIPLNATLNRLLAWCIFLGSPVEEEVLRIQDKSYGSSCSNPSSCSLFFSLPVIALDASYTNYPKQSFQL